MIWTLAFWKGAAERGIKTFAQSFVAALATLGIVGGASTLESVPWLEALSIAGLATLFSLVTSLGNSDFVAGKAPVAGDSLSVTLDSDLIAKVMNGRSGGVE